MSFTLKEIKDLEWNHITLKKAEFSGAVKEFQADSGRKVAVLFSMHDAFIVEDEQGLFETADLVSGIIKDASMDINSIERIEGATVLVNELDGNFELNEEKLSALGLNNHEVIESIKKRLTYLSTLDVLQDMPM